MLLLQKQMYMRLLVLCYKLIKQLNKMWRDSELMQLFITFHLVLRIEAAFKTSLIIGRSENAKKTNEQHNCKQWKRKSEIVTFEGLTDESECGFLVSDGRMINEGFDGSECTAVSVSFEYGSQYLCGFSPCEIRGPLCTLQLGRFYFVFSFAGGGDILLVLMRLSDSHRRV